MSDTPGMTTGYPFPRPFQPQGNIQWKKGSKIPLAKKKKPVIDKLKSSKSHSKRGK